jgi:hypothetical protein
LLVAQHITATGDGGIKDNKKAKCITYHNKGLILVSIRPLAQALQFVLFEMLDVPGPQIVQFELALGYALIDIQPDGHCWHEPSPSVALKGFKCWLVMYEPLSQHPLRP